MSRGSRWLKHRDLSIAGGTMPPPMQRYLLTATVLALVLLKTPAAAQIFTDVTDAERAITEVPGHPGAPAVVLFKRAELRLRRWREAGVVEARSPEGAEELYLRGKTA